MKIILSLSVLLLQSFMLLGQTVTRDSLFNFDWKFSKGDIKNAESTKYNDATWRILDLPHDWSIEDLDMPDSTGNRIISGPFDSEAIAGRHTGYTVGGIAWYRKHFRLPAADTNKFVYINFDGVYMNSELWINGNNLGNQPYGFAPFQFEISKYLNFGDKENVIAVKVKNEGINCRWYAGSGIYRNVSLSIVNKMHFAPWGVFVTTTEVIRDRAKIMVQADINNGLKTKKDIILKVEIKGYNNHLVASKEISTRIHNLVPAKIKMSLNIDHPELWSPDNPCLYQLSCFIKDSNTVLDKYETSFGIREIWFDAERGMFLNGVNIKLKGGAVHANNGCLGAAAYPGAEERRVRLLKEAGFNAVRCCHNPPSKAFLDACDKTGILVIDEAFDDWMYGWLPYDYKIFFYDWWKHDLGNMVLRDRNHPGIFTWSIGNQIRNGRDSAAITAAHELAGYVRSIDPSRPVTANIAMFISGNWLDGSPENWKEFDPIFEALDICGYSYQSAQYENVHARLPDRIQFSSEINPKYCFRNWMRAIDHDYVIGNFTWTAMDYMGDASSGWLGFGLPPSVFPWYSTYCGDIDLCGFRKPRSYYRDILFGNGKQMHIFVHTPVPTFGGSNESLWGWDDVKSSWNWKGFEGKPLQVDVYSSYDQVELFLNDSSLGKKLISRDTEFKASWEVGYSPGTLKAIAFKNNKFADTCYLVSAGSPYKIRLVPDRNIIRADRQDLCFIRVEVTDKNGVVVPYADNFINFEVQGNVSIAGVGNSNPTSSESFQKPYRKAYEGRCLLVIKSADKTGKVEITAGSKGLHSAKISIETIRY